MELIYLMSFDFLGSLRPKIKITMKGAPKTNIVRFPVNYNYSVMQAKRRQVLAHK
jgi:hypothetical protein